MTPTLRDLCNAWMTWADGADKTENGWESDFPGWSALMDAAQNAVTQPFISDQELRDIEFCWAISQETEDLADYAREHIDQCWAILQKLTRAMSSDVRWQVYSVLSFAGQRAEYLLRAGLEDPDPYCRGRALLGLARLQPANARQLAESYINDPDPYMRLAGIEMARAANDAEFIHTIRKRLLKDESEHVRKAIHMLDSR